MTNFSERLRKCAEIAGNGDKLAKKSAIPRRSLEYYFSGESIPKGDRLEAIAKVTGVNGHWLLTGEGPVLLEEANESSESHIAIIMPDLLVQALAAVNRAVIEQGLFLSEKQHAKLAALMYQYMLSEKNEAKVSAYLSQLIALLAY